MDPKDSRPDLDVAIIGAGFAGLYQLHVLRQVAESGFPGFMMG